MLLRRACDEEVSVLDRPLFGYFLTRCMLLACNKDDLRARHGVDERTDGVPEDLVRVRVRVRVRVAVRVGVRVRVRVRAPPWSPPAPAWS